MIKRFCLPIVFLVLLIATTASGQDANGNEKPRVEVHCYDPLTGVERKRETPTPIAHRGLLRHAPENTLPAFAACLELGMGFEHDEGWAAGCFAR